MKMKKFSIILCSILLCCSLNVFAVETDGVNACEALSDNNQVCLVNEDGSCECVEISINPTRVDVQDYDD